MTQGTPELLAHALVARLPERAGARILFIKGPTAVALGVRPPRPSSDVDVLVEPGSFDVVCAAMESAGWQLRTPVGVHAARRTAPDALEGHAGDPLSRDQAAGRPVGQLP